MIHDAPGRLFGEYEKNPLSQFDGGHTFNEEAKGSVRIRKTCCLAYLLGENEEKICTTCPIPVHRGRK